MGTAVNKTAGAGRPVRASKRDKRGAMDGRTALRVALVVGEDLLEERVLERARAVSVGRSPRATFSLPARGLPRSQTVLRRRRGRLWLCLQPGMEGRFRRNGTLCTLAELRRPQGEEGEVPLEGVSRGKVTLGGGATLLFQRVTPPAKTPLPRALRGGVLTSIDWVLLSCLVTLALLHFGFLAYLRTVAPPSRSVAAVAAELQSFVPEEERPRWQQNPWARPMGEPAVQPIAPKPTPGEAPAQKANKADNRPKTAAAAPESATERRVRIARSLRRVGAVQILGAEGGPGDAVRDLIRGAQPDTEVAEAFEGVSTLSVATAPGGPLLASPRAGTCEGPGCGRISTVDLLGVKGPGEVRTGGAVEERAPRALVKPGTLRSDDETLDPQKVYGTLRSGIRCVRHAYQRVLKRQLDAEGKLEICLEVDPMGRVSRTTLAEDTLGSDALERGVKACMGRLRFPPPRSGRAEVCVPVLLRPSR